MGVKPDIVLEAERLRLTFYWELDRYQHRVSAGGKTRRSTSGGSIAVPVFTEVHRQDDTLFLSGHGKACHWSASVQPAGTAIVFDIACRASEEIGQIGSGYAGDGLLVEPVEPPGCTIVPSPEELNGCHAWSITSNGAWGEFPSTLRYGYKILASE